MPRGRPPKQPAPPPPEESGEGDEPSIAETLEEDPSAPVAFVHAMPAQFRLYAAILLTAYGVEEYVMRADLFGLATASPLQRAVCRVLNGYPLDGSVNPVTHWPKALERLLAQTEKDETGGRDEALKKLTREHDERLAIVGEDLTKYAEVVDAFGGAYPTTACKDILILAAIRCAKTFIAAAAITHRVFVAELDDLRPGETARAGIISYRVDLASTCHEFIGEAIARSNLLRAALVAKPKWKPGLPSLVIRLHNAISDRRVDVLVLTATRGGATALSRWFICCVVDEAARMLADFNEGVVNFSDIRRAVFQRIRGDGFFGAITSPWLSTGPIYEASKAVGVSADGKRCTVWAPGWAMRPEYWTPERCAEAKAADPESYETDVAARFARSDEIAIPRALVERIAKGRPSHPAELEPGADPPLDLGEVAILDAGLRKETIALVIAGMVKNKRTVLCYREWLGTPDEPLEPKMVAKEVRAWMRHYQVEDLRTDKLSQESMGELLEHDPSLTVTQWEATPSELAVLAGRVEHLAKLEELTLPADERICDDLSCIRRVSLQSGEVVVGFPLSQTQRQSAASRALLVAIGQLFVVEEEPEYVETDESRMRASMLRRHGRTDLLGAMDRDVDALLEQYDATGEFYA